jgi:hypothetical protein
MSIALIATFPLGADQVRRLEAPEPIEGGAPTRKSRVDRSRIGPTEFPPCGLLQEAATRRPALASLAVDALKQVVGKGNHHL